MSPSPPTPPGIKGGMTFVSSARQGGKEGEQLLNFKSQGGDTFREGGWGGGGGEMILGSQAGGRLLYHDELLVFPQNAKSKNLEKQKFTMVWQRSSNLLNKLENSFVESSTI